MKRNLTIRLNKELAEEIELVASVDGKSINKAVEQAVIAHVKMRRSDNMFIERLNKRRTVEHELYERLAINDTDED